MRILGVTIDMFFTLDDHYEDMVAKAQLRQRILKKVAGTRWGLEVGVLRSAHAALLTSLITYGLAAMGGMAYESCLHRLETQQTNIAARRVVGVSRSARLAVLHMVADVMSARKLFIQQSALAIDRALRTRNSAIKTEATRWASSLYGLQYWTTEWHHLAAKDSLIPRTGTRAPGEFGTVNFGLKRT